MQWQFYYVDVSWPLAIFFNLSPMFSHWALITDYGQNLYTGKVFSLSRLYYLSASPTSDVGGTVSIQRLKSTNRMMVSVAKSLIGRITRCKVNRN